MKTREEALNYALSFAETYQDAPFPFPLIKDIVG